MSDPWADRLRLAARLGINPGAFWSLTVREWRALTRMPAQEQPLTREEFDRLSRAWPDEGITHD